MTVKDILFSVCNDKQITFSEAAKNIGVSKGSLYNQLNRDDGMRIRLETLIRYFGDLECEIVIVDSLTENEYVLDGYDEGVELDRAKRKDNEW